MRPEDASEEAARTAAELEALAEANAKPQEKGKAKDAKKVEKAKAEKPKKADKSKKAEEPAAPYVAYILLLVLCMIFPRSAAQLGKKAVKEGGKKAQDIAG